MDTPTIGRFHQSRKLIQVCDHNIYRQHLNGDLGPQLKLIVNQYLLAMKKNDIDEVIETIKPSIFIYLHWFILGILFIQYYIPPIIALYFFLKWEFWKYTFTSKTILETKGILNSETTETLYYRIKSVNISEPFFYRLFGLCIINIETSDPAKRQLKLVGVRNGEELRNVIREFVDYWRVEYGVTEHELYKM